MIPSLTLTSEGITAPTTQEIIAGLWTLMRTAFGDNLSEDMATPQGQLVTTLSAIITNERNQLIQLVNQFDPRYADGIYQDALSYIYFINRKTATKSVVQLTFNGLSGIIIPKGYQVRDDNNIWETTLDATIKNDGLAVVNAECTVAGSTQASVGTINRLTQAVTGLDSVINNVAAVPGRDVETRQDFELRRAQSVAINSKNTNQSTYSTVANLDGVIDCFVIDNPSDQTIEYGTTNYSLIRNSIAVSVIGGDDNEIAKAILTKAGSGCAFVGNTTITYNDTESLQYMPPSYEVKFIRPTLIPIEISLLFKNASDLTYQDTEAIKESVLSTLSEGEKRARIGSVMLASDFVCPVASIANNSRLVSVKIARTGEEMSDTIAFGIDEYPTLDINDIKVS